MALHLPSPSALFELGRYVAGQMLESAASLATVPVRVIGVLGQAELVVSRITLIAEQAESLVQRLGVVVYETETTIRETRAIAGAASAVVEQARAAADQATELLDEFGPTLHDAAPMLARFMAELSPEEVTAAIRMVDQLPRLREHLVDDVMPLLSKLDQVGPDLHKLLEVTEDLHLAIAGLPGLKMLRRRGEERNGEE